MFLPDLFSSFGEFIGQEERFIFIAFCLNYMLVESLYAAMGFGVYINSRVETEGWDLQILFKKFESSKAPAEPSKESSGKPLDDSSSGAAKTLQNSTMPLVFVLCVFLFFPAAANAQDLPGPQAAPEEPSEAPVEEPSEESVEFFPEGFLSDESSPREVLGEVLSSPDFGYTEPSWRIRLKKESEEKELPDIPGIDVSGFEKIKEALGFGLRALVCLVIGGAVVFIFYRLYQNRGNFGSHKPKGRVNYRNPLFSPESPEALFARASRFFASGNIREAWAACLQGSISAYSRYGDISFPPDATEYGCLALVRSSGGRGDGGFGELVSNWIYLAYGGRTPPEGSFERSLEFGRALKTSLGSPLPSLPPMEEKGNA
jgi:hypothetical protein